MLPGGEVRCERHWGKVQNKMDDAKQEFQEDLNSGHGKASWGGRTQAWKGGFDKGRGG